MNLFYTPHIEGNLAILPSEEARHCVQVLRKKVGDSIRLIDGKGGFYEGSILEANKNRCAIRITEIQQEADAGHVNIHIAIAPTKNISRFEWFLEKATEIGITEITPLHCDHSERTRIRLDRLEKIILSATKQSLKARLPKLNELTKFKDFVKQLEGRDAQRFIAHCQGLDRLPLKERLEVGRDVLVLIGPEGDFSIEEISFAAAYDFVGVTLGRSRLRTETAGLVACQTLNLLNEV